jgi:hypothetical protein
VGRRRALGDSGGDDLVANIETGRTGRDRTATALNTTKPTMQVSATADAAFSAEYPMRRRLRRFMLTGGSGRNESPNLKAAMPPSDAEHDWAGQRGHHPPEPGQGDDELAHDVGEDLV